MKLHPSILVLILLIATGCDPSKERMITTSLKDGLTNSNQIIMNVTDQSFRSMEDNLTSPYAQGKADTWLPNIRRVKKTASACITYIDSLSAGKVKTDNKLADLVTAYQNAMQAITTDVSIRTDSLLDDLAHTDAPDLKQAFLSRLKNTLVISEYNTAKYCSQHFCIQKPIICDFTPTAMISNTRVRRGDTIQLRTWVGTIYTRIGLELTTRGVAIRDTTNEPLEYKFVANDPPGTYFLPIQLHYCKPDGTTAVVEKTFKYTILH